MVTMTFDLVTSKQVEVVGLEELHAHMKIEEPKTLLL